MEPNQVSAYLMSVQKYLPATATLALKGQLEALDNDKLIALNAVELKDPTTMLMVSIFLGGLGIDRFMLGDVGIGIGKLITCWAYIWWIVDLFFIMDATRQKNLEKLTVALATI